MIEILASAVPQFKAPPGTCDTHMHLYEQGYPTIAGTAAPVRGTFDNYSAIRERLGISRTVVVQPTAYGFDHRCTLDGMARLGRDAARGVAVVAPAIADSELRALTAAGMRGLRLAMIPGGAIGWDQADATVKRVQSVGWHIQLQIDGLLLPEYERQIFGWPGQIVIDHIGKFSRPVAPDHPAARSLVRLLETGRVWLKLSAPYWISKTGAPGFDDVTALVRLFVTTAPDRMLWGTNWPHPSLESSPDDASIFNAFAAWVPDAATRQRILVDNPARLYEF